MNNKIQIVECPRDAMQGFKKFIPTQDKADYINSLIKVGFDIIDFGSFVSPNYVPQMKDTASVLKLLKLKEKTLLLSIVLNARGAQDAASFEEIKFLGYPLSVSEVFQKKNSNKDIQGSLHVLDDIQNICLKQNKILVVYLSMAFGNPYEEFFSEELLCDYINKIDKKGVRIISLADTIGNSNVDSIKTTYTNIGNFFPHLDIGLHLHSHPDNAYKKISAAWSAGCRRFDTTISGHGGCPFAQDKLIGNISTESLLNFLANKKIKHSLDLLAFENAYNKSLSIFT